MLYSNDLSRFLEENDCGSLEPGRYELGGCDYANVDVYPCKERAGAMFEAHRDYADIQVVVSGRELVEVAPAGSLSEAVSYDSVNDVAFFSNEVYGESYLLTPGRFIAFMPEDGHMPKLGIERGESCRKIVFKIRLQRAERARIRYLVMDVDGTLTDGQLYYSPHGETLKGFSAKDGYGIKNVLPKLGAAPVIITGRRSKMLERRCEELGIDELHQGASNKLEVLTRLMGSWGCRPDEIAYVGDDANDLECMRFLSGGGGLIGCPADAMDDVKAIASFVSERKGGYGAVRDFIEWLRTCGGC